VIASNFLIKLTTASTKLSTFTHSLTLTPASKSTLPKHLFGSKNPNSPTWSRRSLGEKLRDAYYFEAINLFTASSLNLAGIEQAITRSCQAEGK
jgi:hypothetical protein